jgi:hypothetical protein
MVWVPTVSVVVENAAVDALPLPETSGTVPSTEVPSEKMMEPAGGTPLDEAPVMVAVKVTAWPALAGFSEEVSVAAVDAALTVMVIEPLAGR